MFQVNNENSNKKKIAILISGGGTTMQAIIRACVEGRLNLEPALIIASEIGAKGIEKALALGMNKEDVMVIGPKSFKNKTLFGEKILEECEKRGIHFIGQHGWGVLTPENVIGKFTGRIINQHPGPLDTGRSDFGGPGMFGMRVHKARLEFVRRINRDYWSEATTHFVTEEFDKGAILKRAQVPIFFDDTPESLQKRVLPIEHEVQIEAWRNLSEGMVSIFEREIPLVVRGEEQILEECKKLAIKTYPKG